MAFPSTSVLDNFNRADGGLGTNWSTGVFGESALTVQTNVAGGTGSYNSCWWNVSTFADCEVYATLAPEPANTNQAYIGLRTQTPGSGAADCYELTLTKQSGTDTLNVYEVLNGGQTNIPSMTPLTSPISQEVVTGDSIGLEMVGSTITVYHKPSAGSWTAISSGSDSTYTSGYIFMGQQSTVGRWDNFGGGTYSSGGTTGTATAPLRLTAAATGIETFSAASSAVLRLTAAATGTEIFSAASGAVLTLTAAATATTGFDTSGVATAVLRLTASATGTEEFSGSATAVLSLAASAQGDNGNTANGTATITLTGITAAATGAESFPGSSSVVLGLSAAATGYTAARGSATAVLTPLTVSVVALNIDPLLGLVGARLSMSVSARGFTLAHASALVLASATDAPQLAIAAAATPAPTLVLSTVT